MSEFGRLTKHRPQQLYGVDVSEGQGQIDWDALNAVSNFVMIRSCFGTDRKDSQFAISRYGSLDGVPGVIAVKAGQPYVGY